MKQLTKDMYQYGHHLVPYALAYAAGVVCAAMWFA